jgi:hypothetical protein
MGVYGKAPASLVSLRDLDRSARRSLIAATLGDARLDYVWAGGDEPIATLAVPLQNRPKLDLSLRHTGAVLQLIAHRVLPGPRDPQRIADFDVLNQEWGVGRLYFSESEDAWDASIGLFAPTTPPATNAVRAALATLADAPALYAIGQAPQVLVEPQPSISQIMPRVQRALDAANLQPTSEHAGEVFSVALQLDTAPPFGNRFVDFMDE